MTRCSHCKKKLGVMEYRCKCDKLYCITHLQPEIHECTYDHKSEGLKALKASIEIGILKDKMGGDRI
jgi:hypothetical protein